MTDTGDDTTIRHAETLTPAGLVRVLLLATVVWFAVLLFIRDVTLNDGFSTERALELFLATVMTTIPLNWLTCKVARLPPSRTATAVAAGAIVPPTLEGILMTFDPQFYGSDPAVVGRASAWLLFAIGIALLLAVLTTLRSGGRLQAGDRAPRIDARSVTGTPVTVPDPAMPLTHVQFMRFAGCPVCNLHLQSFIKRNAELRAAGIREVVLFHSAASAIDNYYGALPFDLIADPTRAIFARFKVERSPWAILSPRAWPGLVKGYRLKPAGPIDSTPFGLPADFLIDADGRIVDVGYATHSSDQWTVDTVLALARRMPQPRTQHTAVIGAAA